MMKTVIKGLLGFDFNNKVQAWAWCIMYICAYIGFCFNELQPILNLIIAVLMLYLTFTKAYYAIIPLALVANSGLGTVFMGRISFPFYVLLLLILRMIVTRNMNIVQKKFLVPFCWLILYAVHYILFQNTGGSITDTFYMCAILLFTYYDVKDNETNKNFFFLNIAITIFLSALHCIFKGGILYYEATSELSVSRIGIIGAGAGDPVFSGMLLLMGVAILLANRTANRWVRYVMIGFMLWASVSTISTTAIIAIVLLLLVYFVAGNNVPRGVLYILLGCIILLILIQYYDGLPSDLHNENLDALFDKTVVKIEQFLSGDYESASTYRSRLTDIYLEKFNEQGIVKWMFGGNSIPFSNVWIGKFNFTSHNTYVDCLLRFGMVGTIILLIIIVKKYIKSFLLYKTTAKNGELFLLKTMILFYAYSVSIYYGPFFAYLFVFAFCF